MDVKLPTEILDDDFICGGGQCWTGKEYKEKVLHLNKQKLKIMSKNELSGLEKFWNFAKPIAIIVLATIGFFQDVFFEKNISETLFLLIIAVAFVLRAKSIIAGFVHAWYAITNKK